MVPEAHGTRGWRGRNSVVVFLDVVDGSHELARLGRQGGIEAGEELLGGDQREVATLGRDGDGRNERRGDLRGRHGDRGSVGV